MALDGITVAALAAEIREKCLGGRITRIAEPEANEILLTVRSTEQHRLLLCADPSLPLAFSCCSASTCRAGASPP